MPASVTDLALAPVKGLRVQPVEAVELRPAGPVGDRAFVVVDREGAPVSSSRTPALLQVAPAWDGAELTLRFPGGRSVTAAPEPGPPAVTTLYDGRPLAGRLVDGPLAEALSEHLGRPVRLLARDEDATGADDFPVTLMSRASLTALAARLAGTVPDARRFRMTITIEGVAAWEEHGWSGREVAVGEAVLRVVDPVPRCVVTTRDPERGVRDLPVLKALAELHGTRSVVFGMWCEVVRPGVVRRGDAVAPPAG